MLAVLGYHAAIPGFGGGYVGVDVFLVISGFLITRIIHGELEAGRFSLRTFYYRRARRILPALLAVLVATTLGAIVLLSWIDLVLYAKTLIATLAFASNVEFFRLLKGYFSAHGATMPLLHGWSLAVEEQFYIVFPLLLLVLHRRWPARMRLAIGLLTMASFALALTLMPLDDRSAFFLGPPRFWELGLGSMLALGMVPPVAGPKMRETLSWAGLALTLLPIVAYSNRTPFPGLAALPPCLGSLLLLHVTGTRASQLLAWRPLVGVGLVSYSLYLWHWPLLAFARAMYGNDLPLAITALALGAAVVVAPISWRFVEQPFRHKAFPPRQMAALLAVGGALLLATALLLWATRGIPQRHTPEANRLAAGQMDFDRRREQCENRPAASGYCPLGDPGKPASFLLWGDSHAGALFPALDVSARRLRIGGKAAVWSGCSPLIGFDEPRRNCRSGNAAALAYAVSTQEIRVVILAARWDYARLGRISLDRGTLERDSGPFEAALDRTVAALRAAHKRVILVGDVPGFDWDVPSRLAAAARFGVSPGPIPNLQTVRQRQGLVEQMLAERTQADGIAYLPLLEHFCNVECRTELDGAPLYNDSHHLSATGAQRIVEPLITPLLARELASARLDRADTHGRTR